MLSGVTAKVLLATVLLAKVLRAMANALARLLAALNALQANVFGVKGRLRGKDLVTAMFFRVMARVFLAKALIAKGMVQVARATAAPLQVARATAACGRRSQWWYWLATTY